MVADLCKIIFLFLIVMCYDKDGPFLSLSFCPDNTCECLESE